MHSSECKFKTLLKFSISSLRYWNPVMKAVWLTDIHLVFLRDRDSGDFDPEYFTFVNSVSEVSADAVFITGDIGEAPEVVQFLLDLASCWKCPICFVLGNHDYYHSSIAKMRATVEDQLQSHPQLTYLTKSGVIELTSGVGLVGHDGWPDGRDGDYGCDGKQNSFSDFKFIEELKVIGVDLDYERWPTLKRLADEAALHLEKNLKIAAGRYKHVYVLTHFPPFRQVAFLKGKMVNPQQASRSVCKAVGDALLRVADESPGTRFTVLCGHMHSRATYQPKDNLSVIAGSATYGSPEIAEIFEF